ncbi:thioredoxin-like protein [Melampsora americana]|nr:thioredoxin-like protein [Melampsora americana]
MTSIYRAFKSIISSNTTKINPENMSKLKHSIDILINQNPVTIFSKSYCPYCSRAIHFLSSKLSKNQIKIIELDQLSDDSNLNQFSSHEFQTSLAEKLGKSKITVPQIWINQRHIGGCDDLLGYEKRGELDSILSQLQKPMINQ